jgi:battenin
LGYLQLLPFVLPITWHTILPKDPIVTSGMDPSSLSGDVENPNEYTALPTQEDDEVSESSTGYPRGQVSISLQEKWEIVSPLLIRYMLPLCEPVRRPEVYSEY